MRRYIHKISLGIIAVFLLCSGPVNVFSATTSSAPVYTTLRSIDLRTYNEYRYKMTEQFFNLKKYFEVEQEMSVDILRKIATLSVTGYKYLPDNLGNKNILNDLLIDIEKGVKVPSNNTYYVEIVDSLAKYIEQVEIKSVSGKVTASPQSGNAPLSTTLRAELNDPSGTQIKPGNITWWIDKDGKKVVIGRGPIINYTFRSKGNFSVFLDASSSHRNSEGNIDVLPFRKKVVIAVNEKVASVILKVNSYNVVNGSEVKVTPEAASYGLIFDATSSTPTDGTRFEKTEWKFGNGITRSYRGGPKIERARYGREGDYPVSLKLFTNEGKVVETQFMVYVRDPIAKIEVNRQDGYIGDNFTFSAKSSGVYRDLSYNWEIIDIENDKVIHKKTDKVLTYSFQSKGKYNVQLRTRRANGEIDQDTRIVYVTSQAPIAEFDLSKPYPNKPNRVYFDATRSFDPDFSDDGKLNYQWIINGNRVNLEDAKARGSTGYYTFDSEGTQSVTLEVTDPDGIMTVKQGTIDIDSILSVEMYAFPRVIQRESFVKFTSESPEAVVYEWDFGDGKKRGGSLDKVTHTYSKSGTFDVKLKVTDKNNKTNTFTRTVYVSDSDVPLAHIDVSLGGVERPVFKKSACDGKGAYLVDRVGNISFNAGESINIDGDTTGLKYSWKVGVSKFSTAMTMTHRFDEIGCFPVKLTVQSEDNGKTDSKQVMMQVQNMKPQLSALNVNVTNPTEDPLIIDVTAQGATDPDGVVQSYLWYYYTDIDTQPQDFRSTAGSSTTFVIPKITGNYYFVAILKDNNEAKITSEEATGAKYFTTITGDNINTPIVELSVNDTSTVIGEEIVFTAKAQNILGQDVGKEAEYSWDFDGDGFYDTQTSSNTTTYKYKKSGEFYAKVKVKYRGISSTKNITINVGNKLVADFGYISIGNKFIFFDSSLGKIDSREWDLGDGTKKTGTYFEHTYSDGKVFHDVKLKITEGSKVKEVSKKVTKNVRNILKARGRNLSVFTYPVVKDGKITLENPSEKFFVYMGESKNTDAYVIDYDLENDSDLNGGMDDDEDNKGTASYISGDVIELPLSPYKVQKIRLYTKDADGNVLGSQDITLEKSYIEETSIDPDTIIFEGVTESEKQKIEKLKDILSKLPQQQRLKALSYIQKLQENWNDPTEKTRTILDFENYIFELKLKNEDEFISLLESLLVEGQSDQSAKQITYQALVNLIPKDVECESEGATCYESMLAKLADIKASDKVDYNKALGKEILEVIAKVDAEKMSNQQKIDFKAILTSLVYGGDVNKIPEQEKQQVVEETKTTENTSSGSGISGILAMILKIILGLLLVFALFVGLFYVYYLLTGKKSGKTFSEFISNKTGGDEETISSAGNDDFVDILAEPEDKKTSDIFSEDKKIDDPLATPENQETKKSAPQEKTSAANDEVPDWLKQNFSADEKKKEVPEVKKTENTRAAPKVEEAKKTSYAEKKIVSERRETQKGEKKPENTSAPKKQIESKQMPKKQTSAPEKNVLKEETFDIEKETKLTDEQNVPDWLKGSFDTSKKEESSKAENAPKKPEAAEKQETVKTEEKTVSGKKDNTSSTQDADVSVPDWLKGSFDAPKTDDAGKKQEAQKAPEKQTKGAPEKKDVKKQSAPKKSPAPKADTSSKKEEASKPGATASNKKPQTKTDDASKKSSEELWDDGMKIPDWLKSDDTK